MYLQPIGVPLFALLVMGGGGRFLGFPILVVHCVMLIGANQSIVIDVIVIGSYQHGYFRTIWPDLRT